MFNFPTLPLPVDSRFHNDLIVNAVNVVRTSGFVRWTYTITNKADNYSTTFSALYSVESEQMNLDFSDALGHSVTDAIQQALTKSNRKVLQ